MFFVHGNAFGVNGGRMKVIVHSQYCFFFLLSPMFFSCLRLPNPETPRARTSADKGKFNCMLFESTIYGSRSFEASISTPLHRKDSELDEEINVSTMEHPMNNAFKRTSGQDADELASLEIPYIRITAEKGLYA